MTVSSEVYRVNYTGSGSVGPYSYPFRLFAAVDLLVTKRAADDTLTDLVLNIDYTVSGVGSRNGGSVTLSTALAVGEELALVRSPTVLQTTNIRNQGPYFPETIENALDRSTMVQQALQGALDRAVTLPAVYDPDDYDLTLPAPEAGKALVWNVGATGFSNATLSAAQLSAWSAANNLVLDIFTSGTNFTAGVTTSLTLSRDPGTEENVGVILRVSGSLRVMMHDEYSVSGTTITFSSPIPAGTTRVEITYQYTYQVNTALSQNVGYQAAGVGTVVRDVRDVLRAMYLSPADFGAVPDVLTAGQALLNDTAFQACAAACATQVKTFYLPDGSWALNAGFTLGTGVGYYAQSMRARLYHMPTANGTTCLKVSAGAAQSVCNNLTRVVVYSPDTTYVKTGVSIEDVSSCTVDGIFVSGAGAGLAPFYSDNGTNSSVGLRTKGREATTIQNARICADYPIYIDQNPNTVPDDGEDADHFTFRNHYLVAKGRYNITVKDGLGLMQTTFDGYQAWVGGIGGIYVNDTRATPTVPSRAIRICNLRGEQATSAAGYWVNMTFASTQGALSVQLHNCFGDSTSQGVKVSKCLALTLDEVTTARTSGNSLNVTNPVGGSTIAVRNCYWGAGTTFTTSGYTAVAIFGYNSSVMGGPSNAFYAESRTGTALDVGTIQSVVAAGTDGLKVVATASGDQVTLQPQAAGSGAWVLFKNSAATDYVPGKIVFSTLTLDYRTGAGTKAQAAQIDTAGQFSVNKRFFPAKDDGTLQTNAGFYAGNGAPNNANGSNGDFYFRGDGTAGGNTVIYHKEGGSWVALTTT